MKSDYQVIKTHLEKNNIGSLKAFIDGKKPDIDGKKPELIIKKKNAIKALNTLIAKLYDKEINTNETNDIISSIAGIIDKTSSFKDDVIRKDLSSWVIGDIIPKLVNKFGDKHSDFAINSSALLINALLANASDVTKEHIRSSLMNLVISEKKSKNKNILCRTIIYTNDIVLVKAIKEYHAKNNNEKLLEEIKTIQSKYTGLCNKEELRTKQKEILEAKTKASKENNILLKKNDKGEIPIITHIKSGNPISKELANELQYIVYGSEDSMVFAEEFIKQIKGVNPGINKEVADYVLGNANEFIQSKLKLAKENVAIIEVKKESGEKTRKKLETLIDQEVKYLTKKLEAKVLEEAKKEVEKLVKDKPITDADKENLVKVIVERERPGVEKFTIEIKEKLKEEFSESKVNDIIAAKEAYDVKSLKEMSEVNSVNIANQEEWRKIAIESMKHSRDDDLKKIPSYIAKPDRPILEKQGSKVVEVVKPLLNIPIIDTKPKEKKIEVKNSDIVLVQNILEKSSKSLLKMKDKEIEDIVVSNIKDKEISSVLLSQLKTIKNAKDNKIFIAGNAPVYKGLMMTSSVLAITIVALLVIFNKNFDILSKLNLFNKNTNNLQNILSDKKIMLFGSIASAGLALCGIKFKSEISKIYHKEAENIMGKVKTSIEADARYIVR